MYKARIALVREPDTVYDFNIQNPTDIKRFILEETNLCEEAEEVLLLITLDSKNKPINYFEVSRGTINASLAHPREIIKRVCLSNAHSFVIAHNHPSGEVIPSSDDISTSKIIKDIGKLIQCPLLDSCIISNNGGFCSLKQKGYL